MQQKYKYIFHAWTLILYFLKFQCLKIALTSKKLSLLWSEIYLNYIKSIKLYKTRVHRYNQISYKNIHYHVCLVIVSLHSRSGRINSRSLPSSELLSSSKYGLVTVLSFDGYPRRIKVRICTTRFIRLFLMISIECVTH